MSDIEFTRREFFDRLRGIAGFGPDSDRSTENRGKFGDVLAAWSAASSLTATSLSAQSKAAQLEDTSKDQGLLCGFPYLEDMEILDQPVDFSWPGTDVLKRMPATSVKWEYYACPQPYSEVASLYREQTPNPPYNKPENNWTETDSGVMGVYLDAASNLRVVKLWFIPQPDDTRLSYVIVMRFNGVVRGNFPIAMNTRVRA